MFVVGLLGGCLAAQSGSSDATLRPVGGMQPQDSAWPSGLEGPFALRNVTHVQVPSHDGTLLDGYLSFPELPAGVKAPTIFTSTPYQSSCYVHPGGHVTCSRNPQSTVEGGPEFEDAWWSDGMDHDAEHAGVGVVPRRWIEHGFVLANFNVRGTGESGGCFDAGGHDEQLDQDALITWLASQPWSNGRVGMGGLSYNGFTTWQAAVQGNPALKAIVSAAPIVDYFGFEFTPEGARIYPVMHTLPGFYQQYQSSPPFFTDEKNVAAHMARKASCGAPTAEGRQQTTSYGTGIRDRAYFDERDLRKQVGDVRAPVLHAQGFPDPGHFFQDRNVTRALDPQVPVRELRGWWAHQYPPIGIDPPGDDESWEDVVIGWFSYWLKDVGPRPRLGVDHLDQTGAWHESSEWPPTESRDRRFYLASGTLRSAPGGDAASFRSAPSPETSYASSTLGITQTGEPSLAAGASICASGSLSAAYKVTATEDVVLSGNPTAHLRISSDRPGGIVAITLYDLAPGFRCDGGVPTGATWLATGAADLEYYESLYEPKAFPVNTPVDVPVTITDVTARIQTGHSLAIVVGHGDFLYLASPGEYSQITVYAGPGDDASSIDLPILEGSLG
jgi:uncharacterized protein